VTSLYVNNLENSRFSKTNFRRNSQNKKKMKSTCSLAVLFWFPEQSAIQIALNFDRDRRVRMSIAFAQRFHQKLMNSSENTPELVRKSCLFQGRPGFVEREGDFLDAFLFGIPARPVRRHQKAHSLLHVGQLFRAIPSSPARSMAGIAR
jgi:hypothetical protein